MEKALADVAFEANIHEKIKIDMEAQAKSLAEDLLQAEPYLKAFLAALDAVDKKDLGQCKTMGALPKGVDEVFASVMCLFASVFIKGESIKKNGELKDYSWGRSKKELLSNINEFLDWLKAFTALVDDNKIPLVNWKMVNTYVSKPEFNPDDLTVKNKVAGALCLWVVNIVKYYNIGKLY